MKIHYLEVVATDVEGVCAAYQAALGVSFSEPDELLGGADADQAAALSGQLHEITKELEERPE